MREVLVRTWCDRHAVDGVKVEGETHLLCLDGRVTREVDLCPACTTELLAPLVEAVAAVGRRALDVDGNPVSIGGKSPGGRPRKAATPAPQAAGTRTDPVWVTPVLDGPVEEAVGPDAPVTCPVCQTASSTWRSWSQHLKRVHGLPVVALFGEVCPLDGETWENLGAHVVRGHEGRTQLQAFEAAERREEFESVTAEFRRRCAQYAAGAAA